MSADWVARQAEKRDLAEVRVLGTAIADADLADQVVASVEPAMFRRTAHRVVAEAIWQLRRDGKPCDLSAVQDVLIGGGRLDEVGGASGLWDLYAHGETDARACEDLWSIERRRQVWQACRDGMTQVTNPAVEPDEVAADVAGALHRRDAGQVNGTLTTDELLALEVPDWLVDGVFPSGLSLLFGAAKTGKSYAALQVAWSYATGTNWFRRKCSGAGRVLYLAGEGVADTRLRIEALMTASGLDDGGNIAWWTDRLSLVKDRDAARLRMEVERHEATLVVVDTWARYSGLSDENDAASASGAVGALEDLTRRGCSVIVVHHTNSEGGIRGSTALAGAVESAVRAIKDDDTGIMTLHSYLARRGPGFPDIEFGWRPSASDYVLEERWPV